MVKEKFQIEFPIHASVSLLFNYISTASGLSEWFADEVNESNDVFTFTWSGQDEVAQLIRYKEESYVRFRWEEDEDSKYFFEIAIIQDDITNDVALVVIDFEEEDEIEEAKLYWENKIDDLKKIIGS
ncbi:MAG: SRPBCC domain-containing protein [Flavobacteriales bacterium]|nr:SRPBCC domain-containing protein [Flavobacteriales bacterium]